VKAFRFAIALSFATSACATYPAPNPVLPTDAIKTKEDAISRGIKACGVTNPDRTDWGARLEGDTWKIWSGDQSAGLDISINKADGHEEPCLLHVTTQ